MEDVLAPVIRHNIFPLKIQKLVVNVNLIALNVLLVLIVTLVMLLTY
jgi:hypothetical protein